MNFQKFTVKAQEAVQAALDLAQSRQHQGLEPAHLLKAFLNDEGGLARTLLGKLGANLDYLDAKTDAALDALPKVSGASVSGQYLGTGAKALFDTALAEAETLNDEYVATEHLLLALAQDRGAVGQAMQQQGATKAALLTALQETRGSQRVQDPYAESKYDALNRYARDLNDLAAKGKIDPVIGRDEEIRR
ncbi:MAG: Clp protease N-terminal domain-containing protein, partial [Bacteroidota bacterium]